MKNGICPKCDSTNVYRHHHNQDYRCTLGRGYLQSGGLVYEYVCGTCGYVESYLAGKEDIRKVIRNASKVRVRKKVNQKLRTKKPKKPE